MAKRKMDLFESSVWSNLELMKNYLASDIGFLQTTREDTGVRACIRRDVHCIETIIDLADVYADLKRMEKHNESE